MKAKASAPTRKRGLSAAPRPLATSAPSGTASPPPGERADTPLDPRAPHAYPRRILLAVTGLSPQVVTETLYALAIKSTPPFVPTEIHLVTTAKGADNARLNLLSEDPGWLHRLRADYGLPSIAFDDGHVYAIRDAGGAALDDIRTEADNELAADFITEKVRELTADSESALHVSIAGGRKTMGFYVGYALSLFGRKQDRMSHVLVTPPFESHPSFYYPTPSTRVIHTLDNAREALDTSKADITLADIPFVRLRHGLPEPLLNGHARFSGAVGAISSSLGPPELIIDLHARRISAAGMVVALPPRELAFLSWHAKRRARGAEPLCCPKVPDATHAEELLAEYRDVLGEMGDDDRLRKRLTHSDGPNTQFGMDKNLYLEVKSRLRTRLKDALGTNASPYLIEGNGRRPMRYALALDARAIRFGRIEASSPEQNPGHQLTRRAAQNTGSSSEPLGVL